MVSLACESECDFAGDLFVQNISDNIHTDITSLSCESSVRDKSTCTSDHNISDNIYTDMVSLLCESVCEDQDHPSLQNISDNIHTDVVSPWCESSVCVDSDYSSLKNISDNIHTDMVPEQCGSASVVLDVIIVQMIPGNVYSGMVFLP